MTHPRVGAVTAVAFVLIIGEVEPFGCGKQIASYLGLVPAEDSNGERRRRGHISKQGSSLLLRLLLMEAAQLTCATVRDGTTGFSTWRSAEAERSQKLPWRED